MQLGEILMRERRLLIIDGSAFSGFVREHLSPLDFPGLIRCELEARDVSPATGRLICVERTNLTVTSVIDPGCAHPSLRRKNGQSIL